MLDVLEKKNNRQTWIDVYKGIAIVLVVIGHLKISNDLYRFIYTFHMYAFFFASGITYRVKKQSFKTTILTNVKRLYIPYLLFSFMWDFTNLLWVNGSTFYQYLSIKNVLGVALNWEIVDTVSVGPAWFLCSMLIVRCMYDLLQRLVKEQVIITMICVVMFLVGFLVKGKTNLPFALLPSLTAILFFHIGYACKDAIYELNKCKKILLIIGILGTIMLIYVLSIHHDKHLTLASNNLPNNVLSMFATATLGCVGLVFLSKLIDSLPIVSKMFQYWGGGTLINYNGSSQ